MCSQIDSELIITTLKNSPQLKCISVLRFISWISLREECLLSMSLSVLPIVLCAERVGQMTKTYNDIDAVTRLLEEVSWHVFQKI